jgi:adhesin transport system outer membrane protein
VNVTVLCAIVAGDEWSPFAFMGAAVKTFPTSLAADAGRLGRRSSLAGLAAAAVLALGASSVSAKSLAEAVETAVTQHPEVLRDKALDRAADKEIDQAFSRFLPTLDLEAATGYEYTNSPTTRNRNNPGRNDPAGRDLWRTDSSFVVRQLVFDGFGALNQLRAARAESRAASGLVFDTGERIGILTVQVYLDVLRNQEFVRIAEENVAAHETILQQIRELSAAGRGLGSDVDQAEARLSLAQSALEQRRGDLRAARARYTEIVGEPPADLLRPPEPAYAAPASPEAAIDVAMNDNPAIRISTATYQARRKDAKAANAPFYPRLDIETFGSINNNQDGALGPDSDYNARVRMRYNILNGLGDLAAKRRAREQAKAAREGDNEARRQAREEVRVAYQELVTARERLGHLTAHAEAQARVLDGYRGQFELGRRSLLDLLDAQNELFQARGQARLIHALGTSGPSETIGGAGCRISEKRRAGSGD